MPKKRGSTIERVRPAIKSRVRALRKQVRPCRTEDPDGIHDMRVASRRLRAATSKHAIRCAPGARKHFRDYVKRITQLLSKARELDVTLSLLDGRRKRLSGPPRYAATHVIRQLRVLRRQESPAVAEAAGLVETERFDELLRGLFDGIIETGEHPIRGSERRVLRRYRALRKSVDTWQDKPSDEALHQIRIQTKKLRYALEFQAEVHGLRARRFMKTLKAVQQELGSWNDWRIALAYVKDLSSGAPPRAAPGKRVLLASLSEQRDTYLRAFKEKAESLFSNGAERAIRQIFSPGAASKTRTTKRQAKV